MSSEEDTPAPCYGPQRAQFALEFLLGGLGIVEQTRDRLVLNQNRKRIAGHWTPTGLTAELVRAGCHRFTCVTPTFHQDITYVTHMSLLGPSSALNLANLKPEDGTSSFRIKGPMLTFSFPQPPCNSLPFFTPTSPTPGLVPLLSALLSIIMFSKVLFVSLIVGVLSVNAFAIPFARSPVEGKFCHRSSTLSYRDLNLASFDSFGFRLDVVKARAWI